VKILEIKEVSLTGGGGGQIPSEYQGTYNVYGYYRHYDNTLMPWESVPSDYQLSGCPTKCVLNSTSITVTGGSMNGQTLPAGTNGGKLYATLNGLETELGIFTSNGFYFTNGLSYASLGAFVLYTKAGVTGDFNSKTLVVSDVTVSASQVLIGVYPVGTTKEQAIARTGIVAGADQNAISTSGTTLTIPLYLPITNTLFRWTGNGTYVIWVMLTNGASTTYYKADNINITAATTNIQWSVVQFVP